MTCPPPPRDVSSALEAFSWPVRRRLLEVRRLIFAAAEASAGVGLLTETLKWGEPAYLTEKSGSGSTIRLGCVKGSAQHCAVLFNCRTTLVETFRDRFPDEFQYRDNRALLLNVTGPLPKAALSVCLSMALTYHLHGRRATSQGAPLIPGGKLRSTTS